MTAKILIADKSDEIGVVCEKELKSLGYDVVLCDKNGDTVIKYLDSQHFDAVLMDVFMSSADGMEVIEHINESLTQRPCIVLLSAVNSSDFEERMIRRVLTIILSSRLSRQLLQSAFKTLSVGKAKSTNCKTKIHMHRMILRLSFPILCAKSAFLLTLRVISI